MRSMKIVGLCFIASLALSAVLSASASAKNPRWVICETRGPTGQWKNGQCSESGSPNFHETRELKEKETRDIIVEANGVQELSVPNLKTTIICKKVKAKAGAILIGGEPGTDEEVLIYEECEIKEKPTCLLNGEKAGVAKIETKPLISTLGYSTQKQEEEENQQDTVTVFKPQSGETFVTIKFEKEAGGECPLNVEGAIATKGEVICENPGLDEHLATHVLHCPSTPIKKYWRQSSTQTPEEITIKVLRFSTEPATYIGQANIKLQSEQDWWVV